MCLLPWQMIKNRLSGPCGRQVLSLDPTDGKERPGVSWPPLLPVYQAIVCPAATEVPCFPFSSGVAANLCHLLMPPSKCIWLGWIFFKKVFFSFITNSHFLKLYLFIKKIYIWLHWVFIAVLSLVTERGVHSLVVVHGLLIAVDSLVVEHGLWGPLASVAAAPGL